MSDQSLTSGKGSKLNSNFIKVAIMYILVSLIVLQQMPIIKDFYYSQIRIILYSMFSLFSLFSVVHINTFIRKKFYRYFFYTLIYSFILLIMAILFKGNTNIFAEMLIPFGILTCSMNTDFTSTERVKFSQWFIFLCLILGISSIFYYGSGFSISQVYFLEYKNQIGPLIGSATVIMSSWIFFPNQHTIHYKNKVINIIVFSLLFTSILTIRNRASIVSILFIMAIMLVKKIEFSSIKINGKNILLLFILTLTLTYIVSRGWTSIAFNYIYEALFENYDLSNINSVSAGRTDVYKQAIQFSIDHFISGNLGLNNIIKHVPHNYVLNKWVEFGMVLSIPLILFYLYIWQFVLIRIKNRKSEIPYPIFLLLFTLIISFFEYTYPYGPGTSQIMIWFLLGQYLKSESLTIKK